MTTPCLALCSLQIFATAAAAHAWQSWSTAASPSAAAARLGSARLTQGPCLAIAMARKALFEAAALAPRAVRHCQSRESAASPQHGMGPPQHLAASRDPRGRGLLRCGDQQTALPEAHGHPGPLPLRGAIEDLGHRAVESLYWTGPILRSRLADFAKSIIEPRHQSWLRLKIITLCTCIAQANIFGGYASRS